MRGIRALFALTAAMGTPALAGDAINNIHIENFTGRIEISLIDAAAPAFELKGAAPEIVVLNEGGVLTVRGDIPASKVDIDTALNRRLYKDAALDRYLDTFPVLIIRAAPGAAISIEESIAIATISGIAGDILVENGYLHAQTGDAASAKITLESDSRMRFGAISGRLFAMVGGAGAVQALSAGEAELLAGGSGDIAVGPISGDAKIRVNGSGDVAAGDVGGALIVSVSGSGDVIAGEVVGPGDISVAGSGDVRIKSLGGALAANIAGNGDIEIERGQCDRLEVVVIGAGDFDFGGVSNSLHATVNGAGSISVAENSGPIVASGGGIIRVGGASVHE